MNSTKFDNVCMTQNVIAAQNLMPKEMRYNN